MESDDITLSEDIEYVNAICLDKDIVLPDGCTTATITTVDGDTVPVTFIVSKSLSDHSLNDEEATSDDDCDVSNETFNIVEQDNSSTVYTVHYSNESNVEDTNLIKAETDEVLIENKSAVNEDSLEHDILANQSDIDALTSITRLEDFMDIVTTYKCKFCRFSCPWKSGLMSHIRCCHMKEKSRIVTLKAEKDNCDITKEVKIVQESDTSVLLNQAEAENKECIQHSVEENVEEEPSERVDITKLEVESDNPSSPASPTGERHIFLCGQCSDGFLSLEECRQHMMNDHNFGHSKDTVKPVRKRGRPRTRPRKEDLPPKVPKRKAKKVAPIPSERKVKRNPVFNNLEDEYDCHIKRRLHSGYINDRAFKCSRSGCGHRFTTDSNLAYHHASHSSVGKPFACQECQEEFSHWRGLALHLWRYHTIDIDLHSCTECSYKTFSFFKLDNHRKIHSEERAYVCETCGKGFKQISQLRNHIVIHLDRKNLPEKRWYSEQECGICNRKFSDTKCLRKHQQAVHSKLKPYVCSYCGHLSARKAMLELHMRQHTGEKPFLCEHCDYRTGDHNSLRRHRMRHTGDKPYKCPHCPYACIQAISYKTHMRNKHPGMEGLFSCSICTFKSVSKDNYASHMADHKRHSDALDDMTAAAALGNDAAELPDAQSPVQMQLTDTALQHLEGILPGNITAAQLIYSCLNAMNQDGSSLPAGVTLNIPTSDVSESQDGTQTITIQLPQGQEADNEPYYFTIQQQDGSAALVLSSDVRAAGDAVIQDIGVDQLSDHDMASAVESVDCSGLTEDEAVANNASLVIANIESMSESASFSEIMAEANLQDG